MQLPALLPLITRIGRAMLIAFDYDNNLVQSARFFDWPLNWSLTGGNERTYMVCST